MFVCVCSVVRRKGLCVSCVRKETSCSLLTVTPQSAMSALLYFTGETPPISQTGKYINFLWLFAVENVLLKAFHRKNKRLCSSRNKALIIIINKTACNQPETFNKRLYVTIKLFVFCVYVEIVTMTTPQLVQDVPE